MELASIGERIGSFVESSKRIFTVSKKPDRKEYNAMVKVTGIGIIIIGFIGFIVYLIFALTGLGR